MTPNAALQTRPHPVTRIDSELLGEIQVPEGNLFSFPGGLYGFPDATGFALVPAEREGLFWLQSTEYAALTFLLADPFRWVEGYAADFKDTEIEPLAPSDGSEVAVLSIVTLPRTPGERPTVNLQGPVAVNVRRRVGRQIVVQDPEFGVRHAVDLGG